MIEKRIYTTLDLFKFICACLVVLIHCLEVTDGHPIGMAIVACFSYQAVPFFFITSGFFFYKSFLEKTIWAEKIWAYIKKNAYIYIAFGIIWLPWYIVMYKQMYSGKSFIYILFIIIRRYLLCGQGVYWYILALIECAIIVFICRKLNREYWLYILAIVGFLLGYSYDMNFTFSVFGVLNRLFYLVFSWSNNFIMKGLPFFMIGYWIAKHSVSAQLKGKSCIYTYLVVCLLNIGIYIATYICHIEYGKYFILYPVQAILLFVIGVQHDIHISSKTSEVLRELSSSIYFLHTLFIYLVIDKIFGVNSLLSLKFSLAVLLSSLMYYVAKKRRIKPIAWLLNVKIQ